MATTDNVISAKPCITAKGRIALIPIRYGIVPKQPEDTQIFAWMGSEFKFQLEDGFFAVGGKLRCSKYTLRALRMGYVYTFISSPEKGKKLIIHEHQGNGVYQELLIQNLEQYNARNAYAPGNATPNIWIEADATEVWVGYSPHLWTKARVSDILGNIASRQRFMQPVNPAELVDGGSAYSTQKNILPLEALEQWVEEYKPEGKRIDMSWSEGETYTPDFSSLKYLAGIAKQYSPKVPAVIALLDAEGIGIDTGSIAKLHAHQAIDVKAQAHDSSLPLALQLDVKKLQEPSKEFHDKNVISELIFNTLISLSASEGDESLVQGSRNISHYKALIDENKCKAGCRFAKRINQPMYLEFLKEKEKIQQDLESQLERIDNAAIDHYAWLSTMEKYHETNRLSIASAFMTYDREVKASAYSLELSTAMIIDGAGFPLLGREEHDPRGNLLINWLNDVNSPLSQALAAYSPFNKDASSAGGLLGASDSTIQELSKIGSFMRATAGTDIIGKNIQIFVLKKVKGQIRWDGDPEMIRKVNEAIEEGNVQRLLGIIRTRYQLLIETGTTTLKHELEVLVASNMVDIIKTNVTDIKIEQGTAARDIKIIVEKDLYAKPNDNFVAGKFGTRFSLGAASVGLLVFSTIYMFSALDAYNKNPNFENKTNFLAAGLGALAGINALLVSAENIAKRNSIDKGVAFAGNYYRYQAIRWAAAKGVGLWFGSIAIFLSFVLDMSKGLNTQTDGRAFRLASAITGFIGSEIILFSGGIATLLAFIPVIGWILIGVALVAIGTWLGLEADERNHTPYEAWVNRTIFGMLGKDEKITGELTRWGNIKATLQGYFDVRYKPTLVDPTLAKYLGYPDIYSQWVADNNEKNQYEIQHPKFVLYFPDFQKGVSDIREVSSGYSIEEFSQINGGILLRFIKIETPSLMKPAKLSLKYRPNTGYMSDIMITSDNELKINYHTPAIGNQPDF